MTSTPTPSMLETLLIGVGLYATTNIDDMFLTMAFFSDPRLRRFAIVGGTVRFRARVVCQSDRAPQQKGYRNHGNWR